MVASIDTIVNGETWLVAGLFWQPWCLQLNQFNFLLVNFAIKLPIKQNNTGIFLIVQCVTHVNTDGLGLKTFVPFSLSTLQTQSQNLFKYTLILTVSITILVEGKLQQKLQIHGELFNCQPLQLNYY